MQQAAQILLAAQHGVHRLVVAGVVAVVAVGLEDGAEVQRGDAQRSGNAVELHAKEVLANEVGDRKRNDGTHDVDDDGNVYHNKLDYGVILQPTTYTLGITEKYMALIEYLTEKENRKHEQK